MTKFDIQIVSDNVCPWCYVGKKKLEQAIAEYRKSHGNSDEFSTTFMPFYLNPDAPKIGIDKRIHYNKKFGAERVEAMFDHLSQIGKSVGIHFKFGGKTGSTRDSHRLVQLGKTKSSAMQTRVVEELFAAYFENEQDITSREVLRTAGMKAGLDDAEVREWLAGDQGGREVDAEVYAAQAQQISGVPKFTINGKFEVSGAQDRNIFLELFEKIKAAQGTEKVQIGGQGESC